MPHFVTSVPGIGGTTAAVLNKHGFRTVGDLAKSNPAVLADVPGFGEKRAATVIEAARAILGAEPPGSEPEVATELELSPIAAGAPQIKPAVGEKTKNKKKKGKGKGKEIRGKGKKAKKGNKGNKDGKSEKKKKAKIEKPK